MVKILFMDVDGTLTDGGIYMGEDGELMKRFDVKDGYAIHNTLKENGIIPAIITGRISQILKNRCDELDIKELIQNSKDKVEACKIILRKYGIEAGEAAFIGDDLNDLEVMKYVGVRGCPNDAVDEIKEISNYVTISYGGHGAVREFIDWLVRKG